MKKAVYIIVFISALFSCQKVIDVDLNEANPQIVIEGNYRAEDSTVLVRITLTSSYFNSDPSPIIETAAVTITDANGTPTNVPYIGNGYYELNNYVPQFNSTYYLTVSYDGKQYLAESVMSAPVQLDPITFDSIPSFFGNDGGYVVYLNFNDPVDTVNFYQIVLSQNGQVWDGLDQFFTQDDQFTDGNYVQRPLFGQEFYHTGDTAGMELRTIDEKIYHYVNEAQSVAQQSSGAPANPTTNWNNDALGYFSAYSSSRQSVLIQ